LQAFRKAGISVKCRHTEKRRWKKGKSRLSTGREEKVALILRWQFKKPTGNGKRPSGQSPRKMPNGRGSAVISTTKNRPFPKHLTVQRKDMAKSRVQRKK